MNKNVSEGLTQQSYFIGIENLLNRKENMPETCDMSARKNAPVLMASPQGQANFSHISIVQRSAFGSGSHRPPMAVANLYAWMA